MTRLDEMYTDLVDVYRAVQAKDGELTRMERQKVGSSIPCRVYVSTQRPIQMSPEAATSSRTSKLAAAPDADIKAGDELRVLRGAAVGVDLGVLRAFAAQPVIYPDLFNRASTGMSHMSVELMSEEWVK